MNELLDMDTRVNSHIQQVNNSKLKIIISQIVIKEWKISARTILLPSSF